MYFDAYFLLLLCIASAIAFAVSFASRKIQYYGIETDNQIMARIASESNTWRWLGDINRKEYKSFMKNVTIFFIAVLQKILRDTKSDFPYVVLNCLSNVVSTLCIYLIGKKLWGPEVSFIIGLFFAFSLLISMMTIFVGHTTVSTALILLSILFLMFGETTLLVSVFISGILFGMSMMASSSARKFTLLYFAALSFSKYKLELLGGDYGVVLKSILYAAPIIFDVMFIVSVIFFMIIILVGYKKIITLLYLQKLHPKLNAIISGREKFPLEHYLEYAQKKMHILIKKVIALSLFILASVNVIGFGYLLFALLGMLCIIIFFMIPGFKKNIKGYVNYYLKAHIKNRFRVYPIFFAKMNVPLPFPVPKKRIGLRWVYTYFLYITPLQSWTLVLLFIGVAVNIFYSSDPLKDSAIAVLVLAAASLPLYWAEVTKSVQIGRSYLPVFVGSLVFFGFALHIFYLKNNNIFYIGLLIAFAAFLHALTKFITDAFPARMSSLFLIKKLDSLGIKEFYTYNTPYNNAFIFCIAPEILSRFTIRYIHTVDEVRDGWIVIPGTSSKAVNMESELETIVHGDFAEDKTLDILLKTKKIESLADAKFKTFGTSKLWVHEADMTTYRDFILREITEGDRYRGYAWLLHSSKLKNIT